MKPYSESCQQNRDPILAVLKPRLKCHQQLLEIGSGTGQHGVYFSQVMPHLTWHTSDQQQYHEGIQSWIDDANLANLKAPITLEVMQKDWPNLDIDAVFSANTAHIMNDVMVAAMFAGIGKLLPEHGIFLLYGPFNYNNSYTSDSNARFDQWLKDRDPDSGIPDFEVLQALATSAQMSLIEDIAMPANNRILYWQKQS